MRHRRITAGDSARSAPGNLAAPIDRMISRFFMVYLVASGGALIGLLGWPETAHTWLLQKLANGIASIFDVVNNTRNCATGGEPKRVLVAVLVLMTHACVGGAFGLTAWDRRDAVTDQRLKIRGVRDLLGGMATVSLIAALYWHHFFRLGVPVPGQPAVTSYLCWHPALTWVLFTVEAVFSVGFGVGVLAILVSFLLRLKRSLPHERRA